MSAIAALAADLGMSCTVEGIETADQLHALPAGTLGQGYLLGRPTPDPQPGHLAADGNQKGNQIGNQVGQGPP